jgi:hypothetical protein
MIVFNGIQLDTYENSLKGLIIKKSLSAIDNLSDRKGTASTEFDLPRTAKNELAFENIGTDGAQTTAIGDAQIYIDNNFYSAGKLYVRGYSDGKYRALFMGSDTDLIGELKKKSLRDVFQYDTWSSYADVTIQGALAGGTADGIRYFAQMPVRKGQYNRDNLGFFFSVKDVLNKVMTQNGLNLISDFVDTDYIDYAYFGTFTGTRVPVNAYTGVTFVPTTLTGYINYGSDVTGNAAIISKTIQRTIDLFQLKMDVDYDAGDEVIDTFIYFDFFRGTDVIFTSKVFSSQSRLINGINKFDLKVDTIQLLLGDEIKIRYEIVAKAGATFPLSNFKLNISNVNIFTDNIQTGDALSFRDYLPNISQYDFLKNFLLQFNCVIDIIGNDAYIDLQSGGNEPNTNPLNPLLPIDRNTIDITDKVDSITDVTLDYLQADLIELKQKFISNSFITQLNVLPNQDFGSYLYQLNSFQKNLLSTVNSGFNTAYDSDDAIFALKGTGGIASFNLPALDSWDNLLIHKGKILDPGDDPIVDYGTTFSRSYFNLGGSTTASTIFDITGSISRYSYIWKYLFLTSLEEKKSNKIKTVRFYDHLGTFASFQNRFVIKNQVYKLLEFQYDVQTKLVNAKMQLI